MGIEKQLLVSAQEYFTELIEKVSGEARGFELHPFSKMYLSDLLEKFLHINSLFERDENGQHQTKMLSEMYFESQLGNSALRIQKLKKLADTTLYVSGFFSSSFKRKLIDQSYYIQIGEMVYSCLSGEMDQNHKSVLFDHFSKHFIQYSDLLTEVSQRVNIQKKADILELFDRYIDTGSKWAEGQLIENGVFSQSLKKITN